MVIFWEFWKIISLKYQLHKLLLIAGWGFWTSISTRKRFYKKNNKHHCKYTSFTQYLKISMYKYQYILYYKNVFLLMFISWKILCLYEYFSRPWIYQRLIETVNSMHINCYVRWHWITEIYLKNKNMSHNFSKYYIMG